MVSLTPLFREMDIHHLFFSCFFFADTSEIPSGTETFPFFPSPIVYESDGLGSSGLVIFHRRTHRVNVVSAVSRC